jgi:hypothetical protein
VEVSGQALQLRLVSPPRFGFGSANSPFLTVSGTELRFSFSDADGEDVTANPLTRFTLSRQGAPDELLAGGRYTVPVDYCGPLHVTAEYDGVYCEPSSEVDLFVESTGRFALRILPAQTAIYGGSGAGWGLDFDPRHDVLAVRVTADSTRALHALYFELSYDPQIYAPVSARALGNLQQTVLVPPLPVVMQVETPGILRLGWSEIHPQSGPGITSSLPLCEVQFERRAVNSRAAETPQPRLPNYACATAVQADQTAGRLSWEPQIAGDFNQDGRVALTAVGDDPYGDWTVLAQHWGETGFASGSVAGVIDATWDMDAADYTHSDGEIDDEDALALGSQLGTQVDAWGVFHAWHLSSYPTGGMLVGTVPQLIPGTPLREGRRRLEWKPAAGLAPGIYWVRPMLGKLVGPASATVSVD